MPPYAAEAIDQPSAEFKSNFYEINSRLADASNRVKYLENRLRRKNEQLISVSTGNKIQEFWPEDTALPRALVSLLLENLDKLERAISELDDQVQVTETI